MPEVTPYEQQQIERIEGWKAEAPSFIAAVVEKLTLPLARLIERAVPEEDLEKWIRTAYDVSEIMADKDEAIRRAGVTEIHEMRRKDLAFCDLLADHFIHKAGESALFRTMTSAGGGMLNIRQMMSYSLKTVHNVGFCYGFGTDEPHERDFAFGVLQVACANTLKEKQHALGTLGEIEDMIVEEAFESLAEEAIIDVIAERGSLSAFPLFGMAAGAIHDANLAQYTGRVAKYCFQARRLRSQGKVDRIDAVPAFARSKMVRTAESVSNSVYWTFFSLGLMVCYPPLMLCSLIPSGNSFVQGLADGRDAARGDVKRLKSWTSSKIQTVAGQLSFAGSPTVQPAGA